MLRYVSVIKQAVSFPSFFGVFSRLCQGKDYKMCPRASLLPVGYRAELACCWVYWSCHAPQDLIFTTLHSVSIIVFMCLVWNSEQTAIISLCTINWLVFITETECVYCAVRTGSLYINLRSAHTVYLCVLYGIRNKQRLFPYAPLTDWFL